MPVAYYGRQYFGADLIKTLPGTPPQLAELFRKEMSSTATLLRKASYDGHFRQSIRIVHSNDPYYIELFKRQMYAVWGVIAEPYNMSDAEIPFYWHLDNPRLNNAHRTTCDFFAKKYPKAWYGALQQRADLLEGPAELMYLLTRLQKGRLQTDRSIIVGRKRFPYHGFLMDVKSNLLQTEESEIIVRTSQKAVAIVLDYLYGQTTLIDETWPPKLLQEIQKTADQFHLAFLSQIAEEALKRF